jgi:hypothetical protein
MICYGLKTQFASILFEKCNELVHEHSGLGVHVKKDVIHYDRRSVAWRMVLVDWGLINIGHDVSPVIC